MLPKEKYIWKAKHQRGLSDEQINFFLQHHPRWELLPYYATFVKRVSMQEALDEVILHFGKE